MLGDNIKVHFAGSDGEEIFYAALKAADTNYRLFSCYKYIVNKNVEDDFTLPENHVIRVQDKEQKHVIQDSGLFTLMFGAGKGQKQTLETLMDYQDRLIKFVQQNELNCTCVEIDCQKILGTEEAWFLRERMRNKLKNKQINVFHYEDGKDGLNRLIEFSNYIAISVPELRIVKPKSYKRYVTDLAHYIKAKKPSIDIHLLGCTEYKLLSANSFCTSADSTSWLQGVKYGTIKASNQRGHVNQFRRDFFEERMGKVKAIVDERGIELKERTLTYATNASICATVCKQSYIKTAGNQD